MLLCLHCQKSFSIPEEDHVFFRKFTAALKLPVPLPPPTFCPDCRQQRRLAWRNESTLYQRVCDSCQKNIISIYPAQTPWPVYCNDCWWSDKWDPLQYGQAFDFNKPFFTQYAELQKKVPRLALYQKNAQNSDYTNHSENIKNCYLCVDTAKAENVYHSKWIIDCRDITDSYNLQNSELCYESLYCRSCFNCVYTYLSETCRDSAFLYDCVGCNNCFMCCNLQHQQYCIENKPYSKEEYEKHLAKFNFGSYANFQNYRQSFIDLLTNRVIRKHQNLVHCENCSGDFIRKSKNVLDSYDVLESEDCRYCYDSSNLKDCYDTYEAAFNCELQYDSHACNRGTRAFCCHVSYDIDLCSYADSCHNSSELFGCIALKRKKHCILNKQYSPEEYAALLPKICHAEEGARSDPVSKHDRDSSLGEFFPAHLSPFAYNESTAQEFFPLTKEQALKHGFRWRDEEPSVIPGPDQESILPDHIKNVPESIVKEVLACEKCHRNYKVIPQELAFYRKIGLPIPRFCPLCRHLNRLTLRNPRRLHTTQCAKCAKSIHSPSQPPSVIYCEECYLAHR